MTHHFYSVHILSLCYMFLVINMLQEKSSEKERHAIHLACVARGSDDDFENMMSTLRSNLEWSSFIDYCGRLLIDCDQDLKTGLHLALEHGYSRLNLLLRRYKASKFISNLHSHDPFKLCP